jgi:hypothetical protein
MGHPEEVMGAVLCVFAVLAGLKDRPVLAGVLLGVAVANKAWAVLALGPVLLSVQRGHVLKVLVAAGVAGGLLLLPFFLHPTGREAVAAAGNTGACFRPWQMWWFFGESSSEIYPGVDWRAAPLWLSRVSHPLIAALWIPACALWWRAGRERSMDLLLLLALLFLMRCALDVADNIYYHVPFLLALLVWEALRFARPPILSLSAVAVIWIVLVEAVALPADTQSLLYSAATVPALAVMSWTLFARRSLRRDSAFRLAPAQ